MYIYFLTYLLTSVTNEVILPIVTHAAEGRGSISFIGVCVRLVFARTIEPKRLKLQSPNLPRG